MSRRILPSWIALLLMLPTMLLADDAALKKLAKENVQALCDATTKGDYAKVADLTHKRVLEMMGGRETMIAQLETALGQMKKQGMEIKSFKVGEPSDIVKQGDDLYLYVPNELVMKVKTVKVTVEGYVVGVSSDQGKSWTFANSDSKGNIKKVFPNLPEALKLPETKKPVVEKD